MHDRSDKHRGLNRIVLKTAEDGTFHEMWMANQHPEAEIRAQGQPGEMNGLGIKAFDQLGNPVTGIVKIGEGYAFRFSVTW